MTIKTDNVGTSTPAGNSKRDKQANLKKAHLELFKKERQNNAKFIPRICYTYEDVLVFGLYPREIYGTKDIYIEFCNTDYIPEDEGRTLWKWIFNPDYKTAYPLSEPHPSSGDQMFMIPVTELLNVTRAHDPNASAPAPFKPLGDKTPAKTVKESSEDKPKDDIDLELESVSGEDIALSLMSARDLAAIVWRKPISKRKWLNELIIKHKD